MKFGDYYTVRDWLENFIPFTYSKENLGLERIRYLLELLGNPEKKFKSIHIAGTSGKGSTCWYISRLLQLSLGKGKEAGMVRRLGHKSETTNLTSKLNRHPNLNPTSRKLRVGLHLSPHLVDIRERMQILQADDPVSEKIYETGSQLIPMGRFLGLFNEVQPVVERIQKEKPELTPSYFEILVAASFKYFAEEKVDWAVVEVGLGGRLDATNVLKPEICVITNVGLDHTEILGKTIEKIAWEKAGIIKTATTVITGAEGKALKVIEKVARLASAPLIKVDPMIFSETRRAREKKAPLTRVDTQLGVGPLKSDAQDYLNKCYDILRHSHGNFVFSNALLAVEAVRALGFRPSKEVITKAIRLGLPGRFEEIAPGVILDGAHNPDKVKALIHWIRSFYLTSDRLHLTFDKLEERKESIVNGSPRFAPASTKVAGEAGQLSIVLIVAFKKGKNWKKMVDLLIKNLPIKKVIATKFYAVTDMGKYQAVEPGEIAKYIKSTFQGGSLEGVYSNSQEAVFAALNLDATSLNANTLVLVTGSFYLVGEVRMMWKLSFVAKSSSG